MFSTAKTAPQFPLESITHASRLTVPSRSGAPPLPTVVFKISASSIAAPLTAASSALAPLSSDLPAVVTALLTSQVAIAKASELMESDI